MPRGPDKEEVIYLPYKLLESICEQTYFAAQYQEDKTIRKIAEVNGMFVACSSVGWHKGRVSDARFYEVIVCSKSEYEEPQDTNSGPYKGYTKSGKLVLKFGREFTAKPKKDHA